MDIFPITDAARDAELGRIVGFLVLALWAALWTIHDIRASRKDRDQ